MGLAIGLAKFIWFNNIIGESDYTKIIEFTLGKRNDVSW